jgi:hypothetical protein
MKDACAVKINKGEYLIDRENLYNKIYMKNEFVNHILKSNIKNCLIKILNDDGYIISEYKYDGETIKIGKYLETAKKDQEINLKLVALLCLDENNLSILEKLIVTDDNKFIQHKNISKMCYDDNELLTEYNHKIKNEMQIEISNSNLMKIIYIRKINRVLGIQELIIYNHEKDSKNFKNKIEDKWLLENIETIKKVYRIRGKEYIDFNKEEGYKRLYDLSIVLIKNLCGSEIIDKKKKDIIVNKERIRKIEFNLNNPLFKDHIEILLKRKGVGLNKKLLDIYGLVSNKNKQNYFIDE